MEDITKLSIHTLPGAAIANHWHNCKSSTTYKIVSRLVSQLGFWTELRLSGDRS